MIGQFSRYVAVGLSLNAGLFALYLGLNAAGLSPHAAMSVSYALGVVLGFAMNRRITFDHRGGLTRPFMKYLAAYAAGYAVNAAGLWWLVDRLGMPHAWSQGLLILIVACLLFVIQRAWIFATPPTGAAPSTEPAA